MKLATISPDGSAHCLVCAWQWKVPAHRRHKDVLILLTKEERRNLLEERILCHLRDRHDRIMLIREEIEHRDSREEGLFKKTYYSGRGSFGR